MVLVRAEQNVTAARFYEKIHFVVGSIAAGLAVAAGGTAFAGATTFAGVAAVLSAVLTGFLTVHRPEERTSSHWRAAREYGRLYDRLTLYYKVGWRQAADELDAASAPSKNAPQGAIVDTPRAETLDTSEALARFVRRAGEIEDTSFPVSARLCRRAETNIAHQDQWIPPAGIEFDAWRGRLMTTTRSWRGGRRS
jgi:hypothetical protein